MTGPVLTRHEWRPLGLLGTLRFFAPFRGPRFATWRHFGWELEIELLRQDYSIRLWKRTR